MVSKETLINATWPNQAVEESIALASHARRGASRSQLDRNHIPPGIGSSDR